MKRFVDKVALVTGGARGIGECVVRRLAEEGAKVVVCDLNGKNARNLAKVLVEKGRNVLGVTCDVTDRNSVSDALKQALNKFGRVDILVNCAGITSDAMVHKMSFEQWARVIDVNLTGSFNVIQAVVPVMREQLYGKIINIASTSAHGNVGQANYSAAKAGIVGITKSLAKELGRYNINVNAVSPGPTETEMLKTVPENILEGFVKATPLGRLGKPEDQANVICFLASDEASFITGTEILVCGGFLIS